MYRNLVGARSRDAVLSQGRGDVLDVGHVHEDGLLTFRDVLLNMVDVYVLVDDYLQGLGEILILNVDGTGISGQDF